MYALRLSKGLIDEKEMMVVMIELLAWGVLIKEQLGEILEVTNRSWRKRVEPIRGYSLQARGEDPTQDRVIFGIDHHLIMILTEILDWVVLTELAVKGQNRELIWQFTSQYALGEGKLDASVVMALSLPWCGTLASLTRFCTNSSKSWIQTNSSVFFRVWSC